jgi:murein DD-endopeptidase MepM/ murein hydrolase activator NlpD
MPEGVPALAFDDGVVTKSSTIGTGGRVQIDHGGGLETKYFHMRNLRVKVGDRVKAGQPVGTISFNPVGFKLNHLHFETLRNGIQVDPEPIMRTGQMIAAPSELGGFLVNVGISAAIGYLAFKYLFK